MSQRDGDDFKNKLPQDREGKFIYAKQSGDDGGNKEGQSVIVLAAELMEG